MEFEDLSKVLCIYPERSLQPVGFVIVVIFMFFSSYKMDSRNEKFWFQPLCLISALLPTHMVHRNGSTGPSDVPPFQIRDPGKSKVTQI